MVFQSYALYPHMTVAGNMSYSLRLRRAAKELIASKVSAAAATLGLDTLLERRPRALSGGQRQRVAMGRAIVRAPKAFLFDEPLSNLDARLREQMRGEIKRLHQSLGATSIYVTHDQIEAMTLADRIVAMNAGLVQQVGSPLDLYDRPANLFVAGFIGSPAMNMLGGTYRASDTAFVAHDNTAIPLDRAYACEDGAPVTLGIRPEHVVVGAGGTFPAPVDLVEPTGFGTILHLRALGTDLKAFTLERKTAQVGETTKVGVPPDRLHLFDVDGVRLS
jgi:multiple sugar transport system ATP-binding protein